MSSSWWTVGDECYRCSCGHIPVMHYSGTGNNIRLYENTYICSCKKSKDIYNKTERESYEDGKRKIFEVKRIVSQRFDDVFTKTQFLWTSEIMRSRKPWISYVEVYMASQYESLRLFRITGEPQMVVEPRYLKIQEEAERGYAEKNYSAR